MKKHRTTIRLDYSTKKLIDVLSSLHHRNMTETIEYAIDVLALESALFATAKDLSGFHASFSKEESKND